MRASCAENGTPCCQHRCSSDAINVLLLLALSIMIAMICEHGSISECISELGQETCPPDEAI